ncbi:MAG: glycosyltransferase family 2 protein [Burkholderiales bacterium]|nr:glycosyltransferase family 2 protein [Burkholderiales bacterium]
MNKMISVAMATYNGEKYLTEQLDSILTQTYPIHEIVIVDDGSNDQTCAIVESYSVKHQQIKLFRNLVNQGVTKSFLRALQNTNGEYIAFCDQDDVWLPNKLERLIAEIGDSLLIHCDAQLVDENLVLINDSYFSATKDATLHTFEDYLISNNVTGCCSMIHRELFDVSFPNYFYVHDHYFALVAAFYQRIKYLPEALVLYRQHGTNVIGGARGGFEVFLNECHKKSLSYNSLLSIGFLSKQQTTIKLMRDYRAALATGKWFGIGNLFNLLRFPRGIKLAVFYVLLGRLFGYNMSRWFYSKIYKVKM